jgi:hypothetical protein
MVAKRFLLACAGLAILVMASDGAGTGTNLAAGRPATASTFHGSSLPDSAFDGDTATACNAGNYAPQWIEVDLGADYGITRVDGCADITPDGQVTHAIEGRTSSGTWFTLGSYSGPSVRNHWLTIPCDPSNAVRHLRVTTTASPSWIAWFEIRVFADEPTRVGPASWGSLKARYR